jgi:NitT/TauT family transport system ATP-binding protein
MSLQEELQGPPPAKLVVDHVSKSFRQKRQTVQALDDVSLEVAEGNLSYRWPSGVGQPCWTLSPVWKKPDKGRALAEQSTRAAPGRHRLVMFQESALFPWLNAFGNVMFR